jgi:hypothetical protein
MRPGPVNRWVQRVVVVVGLAALVPAYGDSWLCAPQRIGYVEFVVVVLVAAIVVGVVWGLMTLFSEWQKDAPASSGLGNALSAQYRESVQRNLAAQRRMAAFFRKTVWPIEIVCGLVLLATIVALNV